MVKVGSDLFAAASMVDALKRGAVTAIPHSDVEELEEICINDEGIYDAPISTEFAKRFTQQELQYFGYKHGIYQIITYELVDYISAMMKGVTIEIGSGNGLLASELGIAATDNRMQEWPSIKQHYSLSGQPTVNYGDNVEELEASAAKASYKPNTVIACWVTGKVGKNGKPLNMHGVDLISVASGLDRFILVGNKDTHKDCILFKKPHWEVKADFIVSRAISPEKNRIWVWGIKPPEILGAKVRRINKG